MKDRELIEAAAKAAGMRGRWHADYGFNLRTDEWPNIWNPLTNDGDALRLAVKLQMDVFVRTDQWTEAVGPMVKVQREPHGTGNALAATRRAIVRAAAAMAEKRVLGAA